MTPNNNILALKAEAKTRRPSLSMSMKQIAQLIQQLDCRGITPSVCWKLLKLYIMQFDQYIDEDHTYHQCHWSKLAKAVGFRQASEMLEAVRESRIFLFKTLDDGTCCFYNKRYARFHEACDDQLTIELKKAFDCVETTFIDKETDELTNAELRANNGAIRSAICSAICAEIEEDNAQLDKKISEAENTSSVSESVSADAESLSPEDSKDSAQHQSTCKQEADKPSMVFGQTVEAYQGKQLVDRAFLALKDMLTHEDRDTGALRTMLSQMATDYAQAMGIPRPEFCSQGSLTKTLLLNTFQRFLKDELAPYVVRVKGKDLLKMKLNGLDAWLMNSFKCGSLKKLIDKTREAMQPQWASLQRTLGDHPHGPYEWFNDTTGKRYYDHPQNGVTEIPDTLPDRPSNQAVMNLARTQWK